MSINAFILLAGASIGYLAPNSQEAFRAFTDVVLHDVRERGDFQLEMQVSTSPSFPYDLTLQRCSPRENYTVIRPSGFREQLTGYLCRTEIFPNGEEPYQVIGLFRHNGFEWEYFGQTGPGGQSLSKKLDLGTRASEITPKPGSLNYDPYPENPFNDVDDPYAAIKALSRQ